jgi:hypothetical protein
VARSFRKAEVAEWSKAVDLGSIPKGRGFKPHLLHFLTTNLNKTIIKHHFLPKFYSVELVGYDVLFFEMENAVLVNS